MEGGEKKTKCKPGSRREKGESIEETYGGEESYENNGDAGKADEAVANSGMQAIYNEIRTLRSDLKSDMNEFRLSFRDDMRKELNEFRGEINQELEEATSELQATIVRVAGRQNSL